MVTSSDQWMKRLRDALDALAARPATLFALLLALHACARPYANLIHDGQLYGVQVLNRVQDGAYNDDLFFRYGSQDTFSLFSALAGPAAAALGLPLAFFFLYLAADGLFVLALQRLIVALIPDRRIAVLSLFYLVVAALKFGGLNTLHVHEPFLTPRLMANAVVLLALERALRERWPAAWAWLILAWLMHPLMTAVGALTVSGLFIVARFGWTTFAVVAAGAGSVMLAVLVVPCWGQELLGYLDAEWHDVLLRSSPFLFPTEWTFVDWLNVAVSFLVLIGCIAMGRTEEAARMRLLTVLVLVGIIGVAGGLLSCVLPYALLLQGQPYRCLWLLKTLQAPAGFWLAQRLWQHDPRTGPYVALAVLAYFGLTTSQGFELTFCGLFALVLLGIARVWGRPAWQAPAAGLILGFFCCSGYRFALMIVNRELFRDVGDEAEYIQIVLVNLGPTVWCVLALALIVSLNRRRWLGQGLTFAATVWFLVVQSAFFYLGNEYGTNREDIRFAAEFLQERRGAATSPPTVYSSLRRVEYVWLDLQARSYFDAFQISGLLFHRATALESHRRARQVAAFEIESLRPRQRFLLPTVKRRVAELFARDFTAPPPDVDDLRRLCDDPIIDYVLLRDRFDGLYAASNGRVFVYDAAQVRAIPAPQSPALTQAAVKHQLRPTR